MTLVACTIKSNVPALVSDILITSNVVKSDATFLPTNIFNISPFLTTEDVPISLNQKTYIIKDNVSVTLAGNVYEMTRFLEELKLRCSYYEVVANEQIRSFLDEYDFENEFVESACLILVIERGTDEQRVQQYYYPTGEWDISNGGIFDTIYACGTGAKDFVHWTKAITVIPAMRNDPLYETVWRNACYIARLLATERVSLHTVNKYWGAGFEITLYDGQRFLKIDGMAYVIFQVYFNDEGNVHSAVPGLVLFQQYYNDILFISAIEVSEFELSVNEHTSVYSSRHGNAAIYPVLPIDRKEEFSVGDFPANFSFETNRMAVGFAFITEKTIVPASFYDEDADVGVTYKDGEGISVTLKTQGVNDVLSAAKEAYPRW